MRKDSQVFGKNCRSRLKLKLIKDLDNRGKGLMIKHLASTWFQSHALVRILFWRASYSGCVIFMKQEAISIELKQQVSFVTVGFRSTLSTKSHCFSFHFPNCILLHHNPIPHHPPNTRVSTATEVLDKFLGRFRLSEVRSACRFFSRDEITMDIIL